MPSRTSDNTSIPQVPAAQRVSFIWILLTVVVTWEFSGRFHLSGGARELDSDLFLEVIVVALYALLGGLVARWGYFRVFGRPDAKLYKFGFSKLLLKFGVKESILPQVGIAALLVGIVFSGLSAATWLFYSKYQHEGSLLFVIVMTGVCLSVYHRGQPPSEATSKSKGRILFRSPKGQFAPSPA